MPFSTPYPNTSADTAALPRRGIFRILVVRTSHSLGNTLFMTPLLQEIYAQWPGAEIDLVTRYAGAPQIASAFTAVRDVIVFPRSALRNPLHWLKSFRQLRRTRYDLVIDTDVRSRTGRLLLRLAHGRYKLGFAGRGALTHAGDVTAAPKHAAHFPVFLLRQALGDVGRSYPSLSTQLSASERLAGHARLMQVAGESARTARGVIGIFCNATGPKAMTTQWWADFMRVAEPRLAGFAIVEIIPAFGRSMLGGRYPAYYSSDIRNLSKVVSGLSMLICLDCGIMHLARASGTPVGAVFTTTDIDIWGPYGAGAHVVRGDASHPQEAAVALLGAITLDAPAAA